MKFIRKMDEMERDIVSKSEKIALLFLRCCLAVWCILIAASDGVQAVVSSWPFLLLTAAVLVQFWSSRIMSWKMTRGDKDEK